MTEASTRLPESVVAEAIKAGHLKIGPATGAAWRSVPAAHESVKAARKFVAACLEEVADTDEEHADNVNVVVSELVTNAVRHAAWSRPILVGIAVRPQWTHVLVEDSDPTSLPTEKPVKDLSVSGRGLPMIKELSAVTGVVVRPHNKTAHAILLRSDIALGDLTQDERDELDRAIV
jgi:anti-sigma regulatory factor (Ser/Thr protein kinase)